MLQLGSFVWPNDPEKLTVSYRRELKIDMGSNGTWTVANKGRYGRTFDGEGIFYGENAHENFRQLAAMLYSHGEHLLIHPKWNSANVVFSELEVTEERSGNFLRYRFTLVEVP